MTEKDAPQILVDTVVGWDDYELIDCGSGSKLERFGPYRLVRPEPQALWRPALPSEVWSSADAVFRSGTNEDDGRWASGATLERRWTMRYGPLRFHVELTPFRHVGVFPEQAGQWEWIAHRVREAGRPVRVLSLFGYTGLASLVAAEAGASVTHDDASKKVVDWARENQVASGLESRPIRWIVDDALKFVRREERRYKHYDAIILDPPKFGRGPKGEVWKLEESLPELLDACRAVLDETPLFVLLTAYAVRLSSLSLLAALRQTMEGRGGRLEAGEVIVRASQSDLALSTAIFARWSRS
jgi:23S rRNA (cytosine1962-C5)-methyltransferase